PSRIPPTCWLSLAGRPQQPMLYRKGLSRSSTCLSISRDLCRPPNWREDWVSRWQTRSAGSERPSRAGGSAVRQGGDSRCRVAGKNAAARAAPRAARPRAAAPKKAPAQNKSEPKPAAKKKASPAKAVAKSPAAAKAPPAPVEKKVPARRRGGGALVIVESPAK